VSAALDLRPLLAHASLETRLTTPGMFGLTTASPVQRAICRIADGRPLRELRLDPTVLGALGGAFPVNDNGAECAPKELAILSGIRTGKSLLAAALAVHWSQRCDVSRLGPGEVPRVSIVSLSKDLADVVFGHVVGRISESFAFRQLMLAPPTADTVLLAHPTGRPIEIKVVAGSRAGATLTARWMAGVIFDEFPRMVGESEGVVNWDDSRKAALERILPGGGVAHIGSPWAPFGPAFDMVAAHWGKPTRQLVVIKCPAFDMNPFYWTEARVAEVAAGDEDVYRTDVLGEFSSPAEAFFSSAALEACTRVGEADVPPERGCSYRAAMDPATRGNGWTLTVWTRKGRKKVCVLAREWRGTRQHPLSPRAVLSEIAGLLRPYGITSIDTDQHLGDALVDIARDTTVKVGDDVIPWPLHIVQVRMTEAERVAAYQAVKTRVEEAGEIELHPSALLRTDLLRVKKRPTQKGATISLPLTGDGRHCDFAPSVVLGVYAYIRDEQPPATKVAHPEVKRMRDEALRRYGRRKDGAW